MPCARFFPVLIPLLLCACTVGPDFVPPTLPPVSGYTASSEALPSANSLQWGKSLAAQWWTVFDNAPLNRLIQQALADNHDLAAARATLAQAEEALKAQQGSLMPQLSLDTLAGRQKYGVALFGPSNFVIPPFSYYEVGPTLSWMPDIFGAGKRQTQRQQALAAYQRHELEALYLELTGNVVSQAIQLAAVNAELATVQRLLQADETILSLTEEAWRIGVATQTDRLEAHMHLERDRALLPGLQQQASLAQHTLSLLLGQAPANGQPPTVSMNDLSLPAELPVALPSELVRKRPDILAAESSLQAASAALGVATARQYPTLTLTANMLQEALTPSNLFLGAGNAWSLLGGVSVPVLNGGSLAAEKRGAAQAYQATLQQYQQTIVHAFGEVADTLTAIAHDEDALHTATSLVNDAHSTLDLIRQSQTLGAASQLQLEHALQVLAQAQLNAQALQVQHYLDVVRLFVALGGSPLASTPAENLPA